jgi:hypothetical protein
MLKKIDNIFQRNILSVVILFYNRRYKMLAFLRSNLYPTGISQQPELRARLDQLRVTLVARTIEMRNKVKRGIPPVSASDSKAGGDPLIESAAVAEILLKELRFCKLTLNFIISVTGKYHQTTYDNVDRYIDQTDPADQADQADQATEDLEAGGEDINRDETREQTSEQKHSSRLIGEAFQLNTKYVQLCSSLGISCLQASRLDKTTLEPAFDAEMFKSIHGEVQERPAGELAITSLCSLSRELWQMMDALAFANLYRYHYEFQKTPVEAPPKPQDSIFNIY